MKEIHNVYRLISLLGIGLSIVGLFTLLNQYPDRKVWLRQNLSQFRDLWEMTAYLAFIIILIFFIIYSFFPATVIRNPKDWTPLRVMAISLSSFITLGRGDTQIISPTIQMLQAIEGFIGFLVVVSSWLLVQPVDPSQKGTGLVLHYGDELSSNNQ